MSAHTFDTDRGRPLQSDRSSVTFSEWTSKRDISTIATNAGSIPIAFQRWRNFKEAFAPEIVERAVKEMPGRLCHVVDPFGGSGTTGLAAQFLGVRSTTIEVNPFLADLIEAKMVRYSLDNIANALGEIIDRVYLGVPSKRPAFAGAPKTFIEPGENGRYLFSRRVAGRILQYRDAIQHLDDSRLQRLFRVILGSVAVAVSNIVVSGKGRRYKSDWMNRISDEDSVDSSFKEGALDAIFDLRRFENRSCQEFRVIRGDSRELISTLDEVDLAVFSPPYPNSFDYTDVYNVELWTLGYLRTSACNSNLRKSTLRSHVQIARDMTGGQYQSSTLSATISELISIRGNLWSRRIPEMVAAYFADMGAVLTSLSERMRVGGRVYMVVGDSRYGGIDVPTASILQEISPRASFHLLSVESCRSMRSSPQQGGRLDLPETLIVMERH